MKRAIFFKLSHIFVYFINQYLTAWGIIIVFPQLRLFQKLFDVFINLLIPVEGQFVTIKTSQDDFSQFYFYLKQLILHTFFFCQDADPQIGPMCSEWYSQPDRRNFLEPPWSVLGIKSHGLKTLDIALKCGIKPHKRVFEEEK